MSAARSPAPSPTPAPAPAPLSRPRLVPDAPAGPGTRVLRRLALVILALLALDLAAAVHVHAFGGELDAGPARLVAMDREENLPTLFSVVLLLWSSELLRRAGRRARRPSHGSAIGWYALSFIFFYIAADEAATWHEALIKPVRNGLGVSGALHFAWVIPGMGFVAAVALAYWRILRRLPQAIARRIALAGATYVGGAIGMEMVGGAIASAGHQATVAYWLATTVEETLEMTGVAIFVHALLLLLAHVRATPAEPAAPAGQPSTMPPTRSRRTRAESAA